MINLIYIIEKILLGQNNCILMNNIVDKAHEGSTGASHAAIRILSDFNESLWVLKVWNPDVGLHADTIEAIVWLRDQDKNEWW